MRSCRRAGCSKHLCCRGWPTACGCLRCAPTFACWPLSAGALCALGQREEASGGRQQQAAAACGASGPVACSRLAYCPAPALGIHLENFPTIFFANFLVESMYLNYVCSWTAAWVLNMKLKPGIGLAEVWMGNEMMPCQVLLLVLNRALLYQLYF